MTFKRFGGSWVMLAALIVGIVGLIPVDHSVQAAGATVIAYGDTVEGQLGNKTYYAVYQFEGTKGDHVVITMTGDGNLDPYLGLLDGTTQEVLIEDDDSAGDTNALIETDLDATNTYLIIATRYGLDTGTSEGAYTLELQGGKGPAATISSISNTDENTDESTDQNTDTNTSNTFEPQMIDVGVYYMGRILVGDTISSEITRDMFAQIYEVVLDAGTTITVTMAADNSGLDSYVALLDGTSSIALAEDDDSGAELPGGGPYDASLTFTAPDSVPYYIIAMRQAAANGTTVGAFTLSVTAADGSQQQTDYHDSVAYLGEIAAGETIRGTITDDEFMWFYDFKGNANEEITITAVGEDGLDTYLGLMNSAEDWLGEDDDSGGGVNGTDAQMIIRLPETDTYLIFVTRAELEEGTTSGDYALTVTSGAPSAPSDLLPGRMLEGEQGTYYLHGFGWTDDPAKATPLLQAVETQLGLPGR